jgi:hypothetical protein
VRPLLHRILHWLNSERAVIGVDLAVAATAIVVSATVIGGVVVVSGVTGSDELDAAVQSALQRTGSGLMLDGPVIARTDGTHATAVLLDVATLPGSRPVPLTIDGGLDIEYVSSSEVIDGLPFTVAGDTSGTLSDGQTAHVEVDLGGLAAPPRPSECFTLIIRPRDLPPLRVERTLPAGRPMYPVVVLN